MHVVGLLGRLVAVDKFSPMCSCRYTLMSTLALMFIETSLKILALQISLMSTLKPMYIEIS